METRFCYRVANYFETREFYESSLGWTIYNQWDRSPDDKGVVYHAGTALLEILLSTSEHASHFENSMYLYIEVADLEEMKKSLGNYPSTDIQSYPWGHSSFIVKDPAGMSLKFFTKMVKS